MKKSSLNLVLAICCYAIVLSFASLFIKVHNYKKIGQISVHVGPSDIYPDPLKTPGVALIVSDIDAKKTICNPQWSTKSIRPTSAYTTALKIQQIKDLGYADTNPSHYEEDHYISLELGGNPTDPKNLWPEPYTTSILTGGAKTKDFVENYLHKQICAGQMTLLEAQKEITTDWYAVYKKISPRSLGGIIDNNDPDDK